MAGNVRFPIRQQVAISERMQAQLRDAADRLSLPGISTVVRQACGEWLERHGYADDKPVGPPEPVDVTDAEASAFLATIEADRRP